MHLVQKGQGCEGFAWLGRISRREEAVSRPLWSTRHSLSQQLVGTADRQPLSERDSFEPFDVRERPSRRVLWWHASLPLSPCSGPLVNALGIRADFALKHEHLTRIMSSSDLSCGSTAPAADP